MTSDLNKLRKNCWHLRVDLDLVKPGSLEIILPKLSEKMGRPVLKNSLIMALSGYRNGAASSEILTALRDLLEDMKCGNGQYGKVSVNT